MGTASTSVLVVTPNCRERETCGGWLREEGLRVIEATSGKDALRHHSCESIPLTFSDAFLPEFDGIELLRRIRAINANADLALFWEGQSVEFTVAAIKAGACDFLRKPVQRTRLLSVAGVAAASQLALQECRGWKEKLYQQYEFSHIVAHSRPMLKVLALAGEVAPVNCTVLITGQSGTGKELIARAIHDNSQRRGHPFVAINCAAIPDTLLESELFGYRRGAFTGASQAKVGLLESAAGGTVLLDEIAEVSPAIQAKLLQFLQNRTFYPVGSVRPVEADVRIIAATNASLEARVSQGAFREDLYYRLCVFPLHIPALRQRQEDIIPLALHFLRQLEGQVGKAVPGLSRQAVRYLSSRSWPGNVRELQNAIERAVIVSKGNLLTSADFRLLDDARADAACDPSAEQWSLPEQGVQLESLVRSLTEQALERSGYCVSAAARLLGISRAALRYRIKKYKLTCTQDTGQGYSALQAQWEETKQTSLANPTGCRHHRRH